MAMTLKEQFEGLMNVAKHANKSMELVVDYLKKEEGSAKEEEKLIIRLENSIQGLNSYNAVPRKDESVLSIPRILPNSH